MEKINVAELLKDYPSGMELDCTMWDNLYFDRVEDDLIHCYYELDGFRNTTMFLKDGCYTAHKLSKCVIFPKGKTTWKGFHKQFKDGDIITCNNKACTFIAIFKEQPTAKSFQYYCSVILDNNKFIVGIKYADYANPRFATEEEKAKLFQAIKDNGYKWNPESKTLEKLVVPKFKVGDRIVHKENRKTPFVITEITKQSYKGGTQFEVLIEQQDNFELVPTIVPKFKVGDRIRHKNNGNILKIVEIDISDSTYCCGLDYIWVDDQDNYELVPNKFDISTLVPFESRVLVRGNKNSYWKPAIFGCYKKDMIAPYYVLGGICWEYCIPYKGNEHLLGKTDDCDEYFKIE